MARQSGIIKLQGTLDDFTFIRTEDSFRVRRKSRLSAEDVATLPTFDLTRRNGQEFRTAAKAAKLLREAFAAVVKRYATQRMPNRLLAIMIAILRTDTANLRGARRVELGNLNMLRNFDLNPQQGLADAFKSPYNVVVDRVHGNVTFTVPEFVPSQTVVAPEDATHFRIIGHVAELDIVNNLYKTSAFASGYLPWTNTSVAAQVLTGSFPTGSDLTLICGLGLEFYQESDGVKYLMGNRAFNSYRLVALDL